MDETNQNNLSGQSPADQALPPVAPPAEPTINQAPINQAPTVPPPVEMPTPEAPVEPTLGSQVPPGYEEPTPPPVKPQPEPPVEPLVEPQVGAGGGGQVPESQMEQPKKSVWGWITGIIIIVALGGGGYYYYMTNIKNNSSEDTTQESTTSNTASTTTGSTIETAYNKAVATTTTTDKAKAVDTVMAPILEKTFTDKVKLTDASSVLTYTTNRKILAADVTAVKTELETAGYKAIDSTEKQMTMSKGASTWVITFSIGSETKATIEVTY